MNVTRLDDRRPIACQWCDKPVAESVAKYQACADELRALLESDAYRPGRAET